MLYLVAWKCTTDTNYLREENVIAPVHVQEELGKGKSAMTTTEEEMN